jgi:SAM-dependent methyltransferase
MRGPETEKSHKYRLESGFYSKYMTGMGLDIGYKGSVKDAEPVLASAIGVDKNYPGYDGHKLPFKDGEMDYVFSSHMLEHVSTPDHYDMIKEWFRVVKVGGHVVITVPHMYLYEKRYGLPSRWNHDHKRFYTAARLMSEVEFSMPANSYRVRHLMDNDRGFDYSIPPDKHSAGAYEVECVLQKIDPPAWDLS